MADYPWLPAYEAAILETDRSKLPKHIQRAEQAIASRIQELNRDHGGTEEERTAIYDALSGLKILRNEIADGGLRSNTKARACNPPLPNDLGCSDQNCE